MNPFNTGDLVVFSNPAFPLFFNRKYAVVLPDKEITRVRGTNGASHNFCTNNLSLYREPTKPAKTALPLDSAKRKEFPMFSGLLAYFPAALAQVSNHSYIGNEKHNPGLPMQHARGRSGDHEDCIIRHLIDAKEHPAGSNGRIEELRGVAWRALALLQEECELSFAPPAPAATFDRSTK